MLTLAFESSAKAASVALCDGEKLIAQTTQNCGLTHSVTLLPMAEALLKTSGYKLSDVELFAIAHGQLLWMTYTFVLGVVFALLYDYFDSLWPCILAHLCFNGSNYLPFLENLSLEPVGWLIVLLASLLLCALTGLMLLLYRRIKENSLKRSLENA